jgi:hypothetical protein
MNMPTILSNDLEIRRLSLVGSISDRQVRLKESLITEWNYCRLRDAIAYF